MYYKQQELVSLCTAPLQGDDKCKEIEELQANATKKVLNELVREVTSPNKLVRLQVSSDKIFKSLSAKWREGVTKTKFIKKSLFINCYSLDGAIKRYTMT